MYDVRRSKTVRLPAALLRLATSVTHTRKRAEAPSHAAMTSSEPALAQAQVPILGRREAEE
jgi:hypothetical protein